MSSVARLGVLAVVVLVALGVGGSVLIPALSRPAPPPTEAQARAALDEAVSLARAGDFTGLCAIGGGNCQRTLDDAGRDAVPTAAPTVIGTRVIEPTQLAGGAWDLGGRVLGVCGIDGRGQPYRSEVLVFQDGQTMRMIEPVYWSRLTIGSAASAVTAPGPAQTGGCPAS